EAWAAVDKAARKSALARRARLPRSILLTTKTSGISRMPALRNCKTSPDAGCATKQTVSTMCSTSVSVCPTPMVSTTTTSKARASTKTAALAARARPPSSPPEAIERTKMPSSSGSQTMRARSPRSAPPLRGLDGSTASTPTVRPCARSSPTSAETSVLLPTPGGPVMPKVREACGASARSCERSSTMRGSASERRFSTSEIAVAIALRSRLTIAAASSRSDMVGAHELDELLHDRRELEVLRRVHARDAHLLQRFRVGVRNDAAHDDGDLIEPHLAHALEGLADELEVRARENREAHEVNAFVGSGARELGRRRA